MAKDDISFSSKNVIIRAILAIGAPYEKEFLDDTIMDILETSHTLRSKHKIAYRGDIVEETISEDDLKDMLNEATGEELDD